MVNSADIRTSPSGHLVDVTPSVLSVFGRVGDVVVEPGDYDTDEVDNTSTISGSSFSDALDALEGSDSRLNDSLATGATVSDALDFLLANLPAYRPGTTHDTFSGGIETAAASNNAGIGDFGWNLLTVGSGVVGPTLTKLSAAGTDAFGVYRITSPTAATGTPAGFVAFLGSGAAAGNGPLRWDQLSECTWRARFDTTTATSNLGFFVGFQDAFDPLVSCGMFVQMLGPGGNTHFQATAINISLGGFVTTASTILVDANFHDLRIVRVNATTVTFFVDGVLAVTINNANAVPAASQVVVPVFKAITGNSGAQTASFMDVDDFELIPVAA
jgi:hypothetical protein